MKNFLKRLPCLLTFILLHYGCYAQINIKCAGKNYFIPEFKGVDADKSSMNTAPEKAGMLMPINTSKYDVEIRAYHFNTFFNGIIISLKGYSKKLIVETLSYKLAGNIPDSLKPMNAKIAWINKLKYFYTTKSTQAPNGVIDSLIKNHFFNFDRNAITDSLAKTKIEINKANVLDGGVTGFEIKVKDHYRVFIIIPFEYEANENIKELQVETLLDQTFNLLTGKLH